MDKSNQSMGFNDFAVLQASTFLTAIVTYVQPIISIIFMVVSICSGCILIYKFFKGEKNQ